MSIRLQQHLGESAPRAPRASTTRRRASSKPVHATLVPAAARTPTQLSAVEQDLSADAIDLFATAVGGRKKLLQTLAIADSDGAADKVVNCLLDPDYADWSLRRICTYAGITVADLFASYKRALFVQAHVEAAHAITTALPPIVVDVMRRALPLPTPCPRCYGAPTTPGTSHCPVCKGEGTILTEPNLDRQKLALELGRLTQQKGGMVVQQTQISAPATSVSLGSGSLEQLQQAVGELLFSPGRQRAAAPARRSSTALVIEAESSGAGEVVRDDPSSEPRFPREEEPPLPFPDDDEDEEDEPDGPLRI
jgi:hypothetical protein